MDLGKISSSRCQYFHIKESYIDFLTTLAELIALREQEMQGEFDLEQVIESSTKL